MGAERRTEARALARRSGTGCYNGGSDRSVTSEKYGGDLASTEVRDRGTRAEVSIALVKPVENSQLRILTTLSLLNNQ